MKALWANGFAQSILVEGLYVYSDEFSSSYVSNLILELTAELGGEKS